MAILMENGDSTRKKNWKMKRESNKQKSPEKKYDYPWD